MVLPVDGVLHGTGQERCRRAFHHPAALPLRLQENLPIAAADLAVEDRRIVDAVIGKGGIRGGQFQVGDPPREAAQGQEAGLIADIQPRKAKPGEIVIITKDGIKSEIMASAPQKAHCIFEYIYFARTNLKVGCLGYCKSAAS